MRPTPPGRSKENVLWRYWKSPVSHSVNIDDNCRSVDVASRTRDAVNSTDGHKVPAVCGRPCRWLYQHHAYEVAARSALSKVKHLVASREDERALDFFTRVKRRDKEPRRLKFKFDSAPGSGLVVQLDCVLERLMGREHRMASVRVTRLTYNWIALLGPPPVPNLKCMRCATQSL